MPAGCDSTVWKLRSVRPAPTSSSDVNATSATIRPNRSVRFRLTGLRPPSLSGSAGSSRTRCHAGSAPASRPVITQAPSVNSEDRQAEDHALIRPRDRRQLRREHAARDHTASSNPATPPASAITAHSTSTCRISRARAGADRRAHRHLAPAPGRLRQQQVGHVDARDQQDERRPPPSARPACARRGR